MNKLEKYLKYLYPEKDKSGIYKSGREGYWSNLSKKENKEFLDVIISKGTRNAVKTVVPKFEDMIFSEKREAILELLDHSKPAVCIDYGCMWGVLSIGMAKRGHQVVAVDQTYFSLNFLNERIKEEGLNSIYLVQDDIKETNFDNIANFALVNGVLEWVPVTEEVDINKYYKGERVSLKLDSPKKMQLNFLKKVRAGLKENGKMVLSIENRHFYQYYMGRKDPHVNLLFTTFLPRMVSNFISKILLKKEYRTYIYSFKDMKKLLTEAGFSEMETYMGFPDYHFPELILPYSKIGLNSYDKYPNKNRITKKQKFSYYVEYFLIKYLKLRVLSPAIMVVAKK
ncbi:methyltransferase [Alphaproteobacteria bacterium]|nr:methyltransferase [Alphaproteobacteria bacterium]